MHWCVREYFLNKQIEAKTKKFEIKSISLAASGFPVITPSNVCLFVCTVMCAYLRAYRSISKCLQCHMNGSIRTRIVFGAQLPTQPGSLHCKLFVLPKISPFVLFLFLYLRDMDSTVHFMS